MTLFRAIAYRLQRADTPADQVQPDVCVFFEADNADAAPAALLRLLALAWGCQPPDVEFYNLHSEHELLGPGGLGSPEMGDAALLVTGWYHGPLFARADRTLMLVRPLTLQRLQRARGLALPWRVHQRAAAGEASGLNRAEAAARAALLRERAEAIGSTEMGGLC